MISFALDKSGDIVFDNGKLEVVTGRENLKQRVKNSVAHYKGDWFLSPALGIDWFSFFGKKNVSEREVKTALEENLAEDPEITKIESIEITKNNAERKVLLKIRVDSKYGKTEVSL